MICIETDNLSVDFGPRRLWQGLNLSIGQGQRVRIAGPSGCGKSTLLKCLMGFVPAVSGLIRIDGQELNPVSVWPLRQKLAYLAQEPDLGTGGVLSRLREPFAYRRNAAIRFDPDRLLQWLDYFYLPEDILQKELKTLSGGEKQRLAVILAILLGRTIFLLDEPVSAMDAAGRQRFIQMFREHPEWTALFISHDESLAHIADETVDLAAAQRRPQ
jgi:ABC-type iron transport system FetAB ATPase subunit